MGILQDLRFAVRTLTRTSGFTIAVVLTLALGIGANTAVFSAVRGVLLRPLPHEDGENLVYLRQTAEGAGVDNALFSVPEIVDYRTSATALTAFAEFSQMTFNMLGNEDPVQVDAGIVTGNYFDVMGLQPVVGRLFNANDDGAEAAPVFVLSHDYWLSAFGGDSAVVGRTLRVNNFVSTIVGVLEPAPVYPEATDIYVNMVTSPHHLDATMVHGRVHRMTEVFARLAPGATMSEAQADLDRVSATIHRDNPEAYEAAADYRVTISPLQDVLTRDARNTLTLLMGTAFFVLVIACSSVANLALMRGVRRERELTVREALGAGTGRLRRLLVVENVVLALAGAALGLGLAFGGLELLVAFARRYTPRADEIRVDGSVLAFTVLLAVTAALALAFAPVLPKKSGLAGALSSGRRASGSAGKRRVQRGLVITQVAVSVVLLTGSGLLARTLLNLYSVDLGVDVQNVLTMEVPTPFDGGRTPDESLAYFEEMQRRIGGLAGVQEVALGSGVPLRYGGFELEIKAEGKDLPTGSVTPRAEYRTATPEYFDVAGIPLEAGRAFESTDRRGTERVVVLNQVLAERLFPNEDPIGKRVAWTGDVLQFIPVSGDWRTVVGVVGNTRDQGPEDEPGPVLYQPFAQEIFTGALMIRAQGDAAALVPEASRVIRDLDPEQPLANVLTLEQIRDDSVAPTRINVLLIGSFGVLALLIAVVGIGGVLAFSVSQRTGEIGIRMSLGADAGRVRRMVIAEGGALLCVGLAVGLLASLLASRVVAGMLYGVSPNDPLTLAGVAVVMLAVGTVAAWLPAERAARVQPGVAMRTE
jgi:putative ABC transport system permease protein